MRVRTLAIVLALAVVRPPHTLGAQATDDPDALMQRGQAALSRGSALAQQGQFVEATPLIQAGIADIDRAVSLAPTRFEFRLIRGLAYGSFPPFLNKATVAREDLEMVTRDAQFQTLAEARRERVLRILASVSNAGARPDRFPRIASDTAPLVAAASATFSGARPGETPSWVTAVVKGLEGFPGLLATHAVASVDHPGMFVVFTWWKDKQALNDFFYSDIHQAWMGGRGQALTGDRQTADAEIPSQVAVEIFVGLPEGMQLNGGFVPRELFETLQRQSIQR